MLANLRFTLIFCKLSPSYLSHLNFNNKEKNSLLGLFCFVEINSSKVEIFLLIFLSYRWVGLQKLYSGWKWELQIMFTSSL